MKLIRQIRDLVARPFAKPSVVPNRAPRDAELVSESEFRKVFRLRGDATANAYLLHHDMGEVFVQVMKSRGEVIIVPFMSNDGKTTLIDFQANLAIDLRAVVIA